MHLCYMYVHEKSTAWKRPTPCACLKASTNVPLLFCVPYSQNCFDDTFLSPFRTRTANSNMNRSANSHMNRYANAYMRSHTATT